MNWQALPRLTNRQKLVEMVDPALQGQFALKDLIQVSSFFLSFLTSLRSSLQLECICATK